MAENNTKSTTVLEFKVDIEKAYSDIAKLNVKVDEQKEKVKELQKEYKDKGKTEEYYKELTKIKEQTKDYTDQIKSLTKTIENEKKAQDQNKDSVVALRGQLSNLTKAYDLLSKEERKSAEGRELQKKIAGVYNELKKAEEATGRFQRNVGNYGMQAVQAFDNAGGAVGNMVGPIKRASMAMKLMSTTPLLAVLGVLINLVNKTVDAMKGSEEQMESIQAAMVPLNAISTLFKKTLEVLAGGIAKVAAQLGNWLQKLGILKKAMEDQQAVTKQDIELTKERRRVAEDNARIEQEVAALRAKAAQKDKLTRTEQIALWEQIAEKEKKAAENERNLAKHELEAAEARAKLTQNSEEDNDRLSQLRVAAINAETQYQNKMREVNSQMAAIRKGEANEIKAAAKEATQAEAKEFKDRKKLLEADIKDRLAMTKKGSEERYKLQKEQLDQALALAKEEIEKSDAQEEVKQKRLLSLQEKYDYDLIALEKEKNDAIEEITRQHLENMANKAIEGTKARLDAELALAQFEIDNLAQLQDESDEAFYARREAAQIAFNKRKKELNDAEIALEEAKYQAIGSAISALSGLMAEAGENNRAMTRLSKVLALAQIMIESGVATAKGIRSAMDVPFPGNLAAIATTVATILGGITSAISTVKSAKFAKGGYVTGPGTATSDSIPARLSAGEFVVNAGSTAMYRPLLDALNASGNRGPAGDTTSGAEFLTRSIIAGLQGVNLSVSVDEISTVQDRVNHIRSIAKG